MVSKIYKANKFYQMQQKGNIAKPYAQDKKLKKDSKGFYLIKNKRNGENYKQRVKENDLIYSRQEGVTKYTYQNDKRNLNPDTIHKSTGQEHFAHKHTSDREAFSTTKRYKE